MSEETKTTTNNTAATTSTPVATPVEKKPFERKEGGFNRGAGARRPGARRPRPERPKPEFDQKIINIRRVTRVMAGGRRFSFSVMMVIGDKKGRVGIGTGKASDTSLAIQKAYRDAEKTMIKITTKPDSFTIPFDVSAKYNSAQVLIMPNKGRGLVAGSAVRQVLEHAGVTNITTKVISGSKNQLNIARATMEALRKLPNVADVVKK
ncbi:MAG: 30S ribosomal protein S5 [Candidatus Nomurabacteria bacterium]|nr:30S ribosomal protein S5 [Candidatus Nomurabacteria bacterium]